MVEGFHFLLVAVGGFLKGVEGDSTSRVDVVLKAREMQSRMIQLSFMLPTSVMLPTSAGTW